MPTLELEVGGFGVVSLTVTDTGEGSTVLLLHGGGGPGTVQPWADMFASTGDMRVLTPVHPGFNGTPRPEALDSIRGLAAVYAQLLETMDLHEVSVVGNSIGGWIGAELALLHPARVARYLLVDAVGIDVPGHPVVDFFALTPAEVAQRSYADPQRYGIDPAALPPAARAVMAGNRKALAVYGGSAMTDQGLRARLAAVDAPTLVIWGEADRIGDPDYGRAYAAAIPGARFELLGNAGHLPQIEQPEALADLVRSFVFAAARP